MSVKPCWVGPVIAAGSAPPTGSPATVIGSDGRVTGSIPVAPTTPSTPSDIRLGAVMRGP
jgi:hypothetical protein